MGENYPASFIRNWGRQQDGLGSGQSLPSLASIEYFYQLVPLPNLVKWGRDEGGQSKGRFPIPFTLGLFLSNYSFIAFIIIIIFFECL